MDVQIKEALKSVPDSYDDFVNCYAKGLHGKEDKQKQLLDYLEQNPTAQTDDVMEYVDDVLLVS